MDLTHTSQRYLDQLGLTKPVDWVRDGFDPDTGGLKRTGKVLALYRKSYMVTAVVERLGLFWGIYHSETNTRISRVCIQKIVLQRTIGPTGAPLLNDLHLDQSIQDQIKTFCLLKERWFYVVLSWTWRKQQQRTPKATNAGHVTLLVVDTFHRTYQLWDPNGGGWSVYNEAIGTCELFDPYVALAAASAHCYERRSDGLITGYTFTGPTSGFTETVQNTLDGVCSAHIKREPGVPECPLPPGGLCVTSCLLILAFCTRFNCGEPHLFDAIIRRYLSMTGPSRDFTLQLSHWHRNLYAAKSWAHVERALGLVQPGARCDHFVQGVDPCPLPSCATSVFCEHHRCVRLYGRRDPPIWLYCDQAVPWGPAVGTYRTHGPDETGGTVIDVDNTPLDDITVKEENTLDKRIADVRNRIRVLEREQRRRRRKRERSINAVPRAADWVV